MLQTIDRSAAMTELGIPAAAAVLAVEGLVLVVTGPSQLLHRHMSLSGVRLIDVGFAVIVVAIGLLLVHASRTISSARSIRPAGQARLTLDLVAGFQMVGAAWFLWTAVSAPSNAVSDSTLIGLAVLAIAIGLIVVAVRGVPRHVVSLLISNRR